VGAWDSSEVLWVVLRQFDPDHADRDLAHTSVGREFDGVILAIDRETGEILSTVVFDAFSPAPPIAVDWSCMMDWRLRGNRGSD